MRITPKEIRDRIESMRFKHNVDESGEHRGNPSIANHMLFRINTPYSFIEMDTDQVLASFDSLMYKVKMVDAGIDELLPHDRLMFQLFLALCGELE